MNCAAYLPGVGDYDVGVDGGGVVLGVRAEKINGSIMMNGTR